ncbi:DUF4153 domain-containing protein [Nonomuraea jabiensis]|uniref:Signal transduction histidine-protein kinase/phosphatase MprB n=1 Tax=Nonomuraea jabiensis TaxID=882448 RepID=A0A7W9LBC8_9ACTN|nr:DUF4153 domain-containing protein [Nonomuraea jabiensis]MBB5777565.1 signal transduction histidine kinase [Nonomuraea jabiensis]
MRPLDFLGRIKVKLGIVIVLAVGTAFVVNEVGINSGLSRELRIAVAVVLALIMVQLLAMGMTKPLRQMASAAQTIAKGLYGLRVTATSRDEVGELARAFNAMAADLGEVDRQRRELIANVSHELRTPITGLRAVLENVVDGVSAPDPVTMRTALAQTERLGRLVAQLLDLSRLDSGVRLIEPEAIELAPLVEQAVREGALARDDVVIRASVPAGLVVRADPDLLAQVLANLLDNAVRHSPSDGVVTVTVGAERAGVRLAVADQGPGIPVAARGRVFERFSRLDAGRAADSGGAGLGLAIVKEIVELHGGSIRIDDCAGCRMVVDLPGRTTMGDVPLEGGERGTGSEQLPEAMEVAASTTAGSETRDRVAEGELVATASAGDGPETAGPAAGPAVSAVPAMAGPAAGPGVPVMGGAPAGAAGGRVAADDGAADAGAVVAGGTSRDAIVVAGTAADAAGGGAASGEVSRDAAGLAALAALATVGTPGRDAAENEKAGAVVAPGVAAGVGWPLTAGVGASGGGVVAGGGGRGAGVPAGPSPGSAFVRVIGGAVVGVLVGFLAGLFAAVLVSLTVSDGMALVTLVMCTALMGAVGAGMGAGSGRRAAVAAYQSAQVAAYESAAQAAGLTATGQTAGITSAGQTAGNTAAAQAAGTTAAGHAGGNTAAGQAAGITTAGNTAVGSPQGTAPYRNQGGPPPYVPPPLFPRPELPDSPRWLLPAAAGAGVFAAVALPEAQVGLGIVLVAVVLGAAALPAVVRRMTPWTVAFGLTAYFLISMAAVRDADWLVGILLVAGAGLGALAVSGAGAGWLGVVRGGVSVLLALGPVPWFLAQPLKKLSARRRVMPMLAALGITAVLLLVFGLLFASADAVFASFLERLTTAPDWAESAPQRIFLFALFAVLLAAVVLVALRPVVDPVGPETKFSVSRSVWIVPLTAVNLLFASFVAVQITALFGGNTWVLKTAGLTYAEYARQGFFQLVVVSVFVLGIVAVASGLLKVERRERWLLAVLLGVLCGLTMVVLASALHRMNLYTEAYGLSRLRLSVQATVWWLGTLFALVLLAGAARFLGRGSGWLPRTVVLVTGLGLGAFAIVNPDLQVAHTQVEVRGVSKLDSDYLGDLGAEAVPALDKLPEPQRSCVLADVVAANGLSRPDPWNGWNLDRARARAVLAARPIDKSVQCPPAYSRGSD